MSMHVQEVLEAMLDATKSKLGAKWEHVSSAVCAEYDDFIQDVKQIGYRIDSGELTRQSGVVLVEERLGELREHLCERVGLVEEESAKAVDAALEIITGRMGGLLKDIVTL